MRKFKFRIWDGNRNKFYYTHEKDSIYYSMGRAVDCVNGFFHRIEQVQEDSSLTLQQWIGEQDKNGVDVYEGDIIRFSPDVSRFLHVESNLGHVWIPSIAEGAVVSFDGFYSDNLDCFIDSLRQYYPDTNEPVQLEYEVVGNIFENPEIFDEKT